MTSPVCHHVCLQLVGIKSGFLRGYKYVAYWYKWNVLDNASVVVQQATSQTLPPLSPLLPKYFSTELHIFSLCRETAYKVMQQIRKAKCRRGPKQPTKVPKDVDDGIFYPRN